MKCASFFFLSVAQLTEQNHRLTSELQGALSREQELQDRINQLRDQVFDKRATVQDHVTHLEILREEMELVSRRKSDLEKKVEQLITERDQLNAVLDESSDKILFLEKHTREQDCQVHKNTYIHRIYLVVYCDFYVIFPIVIFELHFRKIESGNTERLFPDRVPEENTLWLYLSIAKRDLFFRQMGPNPN